MNANPWRNIDRFSRDFENTKPLKTIIIENPNIDWTRYQDYLDARLNREQEAAFIDNKLSLEEIRKISEDTIKSLSEESRRLLLEQRQQEKRHANLLERQMQWNTEQNEAQWEAERLMREWLEASEWINEALDSAELTQEERADASVLSRATDTLKSTWKWFVWSLDSWISYWEKTENKGRVIGFLASVVLFFLNWMKWLMGLFWIEWDKEKNIKDLIKTPEYIKTKDIIEETTFSYIEKATWHTLSNDEKNILKSKLDPENKDSYINLNEYYLLIEKVKKWEKIDFSDLWKLNILPKMMKDPDFEKIFQDVIAKSKEKIYLQLKEVLSKSWVIINEWTEKEKTLKDIISRKISESRLKTFIDKWEWSFLDIWLIWIESALFIPEIIWELWQEDIIDISNLAIWVAERWWDRISLWLQALSWIDIAPQLAWEISFSAFEKMIDGLDQKKKILLLRSFYTELWLIWSILGYVWYSATSAWINIFEKMYTAWKIEAWSLKSMLSKLNDAPVDKLWRLLEKLEWTNWNWIKEIRDSIKITLESYELTAKINNPNIDAASKKEIAKKIQALESEFKQIVSNSKFLSEWITSKAIKWPIKFWVLKETFEGLWGILKTNSELALDISSWNKLARLRQINTYINTFKLRSISWNVVMHLSEWQSLKNLLTATKDLAPSTIKFLFWRVPMILIGTSLFNEAAKEITDWSWNLYTTILALNWILWWLMLFDEARVSILNWEFNIKEAWKWMLWLTVIWIESWLIVKDTIKYWPKNRITALPKAIWKSIFRIPYELYDTWKWWIKKWGEIAKLWREILKRISKKWIYWAWIALILWAILAYSWIEGDNISESIDKFIDKEWNLKLEALKAEWWKLKQEDRLSLLKIISIWLLPENISEDDIDFELNGNEFTLVIKSDFYEKNSEVILWTKTALFNILFNLSSDLEINIKTK